MSDLGLDILIIGWAKEHRLPYCCIEFAVNTSIILCSCHRNVVVAIIAGSEVQYNHRYSNNLDTVYDSINADQPDFFDRLPQILDEQHKKAIIDLCKICKSLECICG